MTSHNEEIIGVDVGAARVGIARGGTAARLAEPLKTVPAETAGAELKYVINKYDAKALVIGLPRGLNGSDTAQTREVRKWAESIKPSLAIPMFWQDEALTSHAAETAGRGRAGSDADAATIILQDFLDGPENDRVAV